MKNVIMEIKAGKLIITVDLKETHGLSGTGKNIIVASTEGNHGLGIEGIKVGVNVYKPAPAQQP